MLLKPKGSRYSAKLHLSFRIEKQDDDEWPWCVSLISIGPRGTGLVPDNVIPVNTNVDCGHCSAEAPKPGRRICDACAVEEWVACAGAEDFLEKAHIKVGYREGVMHVHGHVEWPVHEDDEETFHANYLQWDHSPFHCLLEEEIEEINDENVMWDPGWYFYDETWASRHGPFTSYEETETAWQKYTEHL